MSNQKPVPGTGGEHYIPYGERTGGESVVYFTRDLSAEGLRRLFPALAEPEVFPDGAQPGEHLPLLPVAADMEQRPVKDLLSQVLRLVGIAGEGQKKAVYPVIVDLAGRCKILAHTPPPPGPLFVGSTC